MTTIVTDGRAMAADGRVTAANEIRTETYTKVRAMPDGSLVGQAGNLAHGRSAVRELYRAVLAHEEPEELEGDYNLLRLFPSGAVQICPGNLQACYFVEPPQAIGSGADFARGALAAGASPKKAVSIAHRFDWATGPLHTYLRP